MIDECKKMSPDTQYQVVANEYISALQCAQTVIVINLAISIGILGAMTTMLATGNYKGTINLVALSILSVVGLLGSICCIRTLYISREQLISFQKRMIKLEEDYGIEDIHEKFYYKPLHITLFGFWVFTAMCIVVLAVCLVALIIPEKFGLLSILVVLVMLVLSFFGIVKLSDICYDKVQKKLLK